MSQVYSPRVIAYALKYYRKVTHSPSHLQEILVLFVITICSPDWCQQAAWWSACPAPFTLYWALVVVLLFARLSIQAPLKIALISSWVIRPVSNFHKSAMTCQFNRFLTSLHLFFIDSREVHCSNNPSLTLICAFIGEFFFLWQWNICILIIARWKSFPYPS